jgi:hypothetical protein
VLGIHDCRRPNLLPSATVVRRGRASPPHFCNPFESATYGDLLCICLTTHGLSAKGILRPHAVENRSRTQSEVEVLSRKSNA